MLTTSGDEPLFHFVRLTDLKASCRSNYPGADIDAVGAIGSALQFSLSGAVLFEFNKADLRSEAEQQLADIVKKILELPNARIVIEGHTDNVGTARANLSLSKRRGEAVARFFKKSGLQGRKTTVRGFGAARPVEPNDTDEGRQRNRRVTIVVLPP